MTDFNQKIIGAIGKGNHVNQTIHLEPGQPSPHQLPTDIGDFTGRKDYIARIEEILTLGKIVTISGIPGVGKSALAIHAAHRLKDRYPDAQLHVNLHGQTPESALETKTVLIRVLNALTGRDESQLATDLDGLVAQYRSTLADKRALIILDNARDEGQIRDLLPSSLNCAVVVTSRSRLTGLPGAGSIALEPMAVGIDGELGDAEVLFQAILQDHKRVEAELAAAREIVKLCGGLPIAIRITAATLKQQIWVRKSLQAYAQELDTELRLDKLENEHVEQAIPGQGSVRASFNLSYQALTKEEQQLFRYAGGLPGVNFGLEILAVVMEREKSQIESGLGRLLEAQVLESRGDDRFGWHDLMRLFAKAQLTDPERETVLNRGLTWYCEQANFWGNGLNPVSCRQLTQTSAATTENDAEDLERVLPIMALDWFTAERNNWVDVVRDLTQIPRLDDAIVLAANLASFFDRRSIWGDWVITHELVKDCAQQAGNLAGVAQTLNNLGIVYQSQGKWDEAIDCYEQDLEISRRLGDEHGVATTLNNLGNVYDIQGKWDEAIDCYEQSLETKRQLGDEHGVGITLKNLGLLYDRRNQPEKARILWQEALIYLNPTSSDFQTVQQWLENPSKPSKMNYLLPLAVGGSILFCLVKGCWLLAIFGVATILFCFRRSIFRRNYDLSD
jgi:tetratricopeptide (TPR) repeat protein